MKSIKNRCGFALFEVMVGITVFTIGVLGLNAMQYRAINQNSHSWDRSQANSVALAVLEELKRIPFTDARLANGNGNLDAGMPPAGSDVPTPGNADYRFSVANFPVFNNSYIDRPGDTIATRDGKHFQVFYNVLRSAVTIGGNIYTPSATIKLFVYWDGALGRSHLEMITVKFNNTPTTP